MNPHGIYSIESSGRIVFVDATGPFNDETIRRYVQDMTAEINSLPPGPWAMFTIFRDLSLFTPEAERELSAFTQWRKKMGMETIALVFLDIVGADILKTQLGRIHNVDGIEYAYFDTCSNARTWLAEKGYQIGQASPQFTS